MAYIFSCLFLIFSSSSVFARIDFRLEETKITLRNFVAKDSWLDLLSDDASFFAQLSNDGVFRLWALSAPDEPYYLLGATTKNQI